MSAKENGKQQDDILDLPNYRKQKNMHFGCKAFVSYV